jgi:large subunit ribosomal protein L25
MVQADEGTMLKVNLPVEFKGEDACPGLKKGTASFISFSTTFLGMLSI